MNVIWTMRNVLIARFFRFVSSALYLLKSESVFKQPVEFFYTNRAHTELRSHCDGMLQHRIFLPHIYVRLLSSSCDMCVVYYRPRSIRAAAKSNLKFSSYTPECADGSFVLPFVRNEWDFETFWVSEGLREGNARRDETVRGKSFYTAIACSIVVRSCKLRRLCSRECSYPKARNSLSTRLVARTADARL